MSRFHTSTQRRRFIKGVALLPVAALFAHGRAAAELLSLDDPIAQQLRYTDVSTNPEQNCANCALYQATGDDRGTCAIFPERKVAADGWCVSWAPRP